jgi:hypothetical protein
MEQIVLNFDASGFESFEGTHECFSHQTRCVRDESGRPIKQAVQAMEMDFSPSQWSQKVNQSNNTSVNLNDADHFTELYGDTTWIHYAVWKHIVCANRGDEIEQLEKQLAAARARLKGAS